MYLKHLESTLRVVKSRTIIKVAVCSYGLRMSWIHREYDEGEDTDDVE